MSGAAEFRAALERAGLTQAELARRLGIAPITVNRFAQGRAPVPRYAMAYLDLLGEVRAFARRIG